MSRFVKIPNPPLILVKLSNKTDPVISIGCCSQLLELFKSAKLVDAAASALSVTPDPDITENILRDWIKKTISFKRNSVTKCRVNISVYVCSCISQTARRPTSKISNP